MKQYHDLIRYVLENGVDVQDRTGVGTRSVFGYQMRFDLNDGFPAVTTKKLVWKAVVGELLWFLEGSTDERRLAELTYGKSRDELVGKTTIWTANADKQGVDLGHYNDDYIKELGPVYGYNWRHFDYYQNSLSGEDQIVNIINEIEKNPDSRRLILTAWNPILLDSMTLPPCHLMAHFRVYDGRLSCLMYQRSMDIGLGAPFNVASYSLLTHLIARQCNLGVGEFVHSIGDAHIYNNHIESLQSILDREPYPLPTLEIDDDFNLMDRLCYAFKLDDVSKMRLNNYICHETVKMSMAV
jgi:thymidylate synthase